MATMIQLPQTPEANAKLAIAAGKTFYEQMYASKTVPWEELRHETQVYYGKKAIALLTWFVTELGVGRGP